MIGTVDEVISVSEAEGIDADIRRTDELPVATNAPQLNSAPRRVCACQGLGTDRANASPISTPAEARARIAVENVRGAFVIKKRGARAAGQAGAGAGQSRRAARRADLRADTVLSIEKGKVDDRSRHGARRKDHPRHGRLHRRHSRAMNGSGCRSTARTSSPSRCPTACGKKSAGTAMRCWVMRRTPIATRSAPARAASPWAGAACPIVSARRPTCAAHPAGDDRKLHKILVTLLPQTRGLALDHAWCGTLGVPRDWCTTVGLRSGRPASAGPAAMSGSASRPPTFPAAPCATSCCGRDTELTRLPWVNRTVKKWEPEPLRWLGVHSMYQLYRIADEREANGLGRTSRLAALADRLTGH